MRSKEDLEYINTLSQAMLLKTPKKIKISIIFWFIFIVFAIIWMNFTLIDEISRASGEVIPSGNNQKVQNLEGGIVSEILVKDGDEVKKGDLLVKIKNQKSISSLQSSSVNIDALKAKIKRLKAEISDVDFKVKDNNNLYELREVELFKSNKNRLKNEIAISKSQLEQKKQSLNELNVKIKYLKDDLDLLDEQLRMIQPLVSRGVKSKVDYIKLKREKTSKLNELETSKASIPRVKSEIDEIITKIKKIKIDFKNKASSELNEAIAKLDASSKNSEFLNDQVVRLDVKAPINGVIYKVYVNTIGGVIKPGEDIVEIVPKDDALLVEVKVKPSDIAFIYKGLKANLKFTAYDFAIYGGLSGKVFRVSPDTIKDEKDNIYYLVTIKTDRSYLGSKDKKLKIIPGMLVNADIITGKKSLLDYILKPILRAKEYSFAER